MKNRGCKVDECTSRHVWWGLCERHKSLWFQGAIDVPGLTRRPQRVVDKDGYVVVATSDGVVKSEHRHVMEQMLGRPLRPGENVHHINGIRSDNSPENLELWVRQQPAGQRVEDLITFVVRSYRRAVIEALIADEWRLGKFHQPELFPDVAA